MRGIAILAVLCYHAALVSGQRFELQLAGVTLSLQAIAATGFLGVDLFFFLSGFCLFYPYARRRLEGGPPLTLRYFASRRLLKIVPSYVVALTAFAIALHWKFDSWGEDAAHYAAHLLFVHPLFASTFESISGPFWTLGVEVQFYVLFPLIAQQLAIRPLATVVAISALAEGYRLTLLATGHADSFYAVNQLPAYIDIFTAGMLAAYAVVYARTRIPDLARYRGALTAVSLGSVCLAALALAWLANSPAIQTDSAFFEWQTRMRPALALVLTVVGISSSLAGAGWQRAIANPLLLFFSTISYNLYLWHLEILVWVHNLSLDPWLVLGLSVAAAIATATVMTYAFELPILRGDWAPLVSRIPRVAPFRRRTVRTNAVAG